MGVAFPANVPLCRVVIDQIATALDTATAKQWTGSGTAKPDHDRYRAPSVPGGTDGLYIDDKAVSFTIANGDRRVHVDERQVPGVPEGR